MRPGRAIVLSWVALLALLALTIAASFAPLGPVLPFVSYGIAFAKTAIVVWIFMELRVREGLQRLALAAGFVWAAILFVLLLADVLTRGGPP
jgi:cytochrome c oxidase subunit IV